MRKGRDSPAFASRVSSNMPGFRSRLGQQPRKGMQLRLVGALVLIMVVLLTALLNMRASFPGLLPGKAKLRVPVLPGMHRGEVFSCDRSHYRTDVCTMKGDVRMVGSLSRFVLYTALENTSLGEERIRPYTRKWEQSTMDSVHEVVLRSVRGSGEEMKHAPECDVNHTVPAVVFTTGGYTGNLYHEFNDGLIPVYVTSQHLKGEVVFIIVEYHDWWFTKYRDVVRQLTNHEVIDLEGDGRVHCFPEVTVGVHFHEELAVVPELMPGGESIRGFRAVLDRAYRGGEEESSMAVNEKRKMHPGRPKLVILARNDSRIIMNLEQIEAAAQQVGFAVRLLIPDATMELRDMYKVLDSCDVMLGVHGAAMTHFLFMRPGAVFIQIIPLGTDWAAWTYYGEPATKLGLHYLPYKIEPSESSLSDKYDQDDPVLRDPQSIADLGWATVKEIYLKHQDVRPSVHRMKQVLEEALTYVNSPEYKAATASPT